MKNPEELKKRDKPSLEDMVNAIQGKGINNDLAIKSNTKLEKVEDNNDTSNTDGLTSAVSDLDNSPIAEAKKNNSEGSVNKSSKSKVLPSSIDSIEKTSKPTKEKYKTNISLRRDLLRIIRFEYKIPANQFIEALVTRVILKKHPKYKEELELNNSKKRSH